MFFYALLLLFDFVSVRSPMTLFMAPNYALLLFLLAAPAAHLLQFRLGRRSICIWAQPVDQVSAFPRESKQSLGVCCLLFALYLAAVVAAVGGAIPAYPVLLLEQNRFWVTLALVVVYRFFSRGRVSLPADLLFTGLFLAFYKINETLGSISSRTAFVPALTQSVLGWLTVTVLCFLLLEIFQKLRQRKRAAAVK